MKRVDKFIAGWSDYQLIDSGQGRKLENFAGVILDRPDPQAIWSKGQPEKWLNFQAQFSWVDKGERWKIEKNLSENWIINWQNLKLNLSLNGFKHIGIFPEHSGQWQEIIDLGQKNRGLKMLNLFGYTGAMSLAAVSVGMEVTHIDASKTTIEKVKENYKLSELEASGGLKVICEDSLKYVKRLVNRAEKFEVIILDPPAFGRGPKGEVWKIEESLIELIALLPKLLSDRAQMVILNGYASGFAALTFGEILGTILPEEKIVYGDIGLVQSDKGKILSTGIYAKWQND